MKKLLVLLLGLTAILPAIVLFGCGSSTTSSGNNNSGNGGSNGNGAPVVSFTAAPSTVSAGQQVTLAWSTSGGVTSLTIDNGVGDQSSKLPNGSVTVRPASTTTYTATATGPSGVLTKQSVVVNVSPRSVPPFGHVMVVLEENHGYASVIGTMPYLNTLANKYGLATNYYANTHPSIGNYFMLTTGQILTNDDAMTPASFPVSADNVVRQLITAGKTWKSYAESLPSVGYTGSDVYPYSTHHNPFAYFTDVQNSASQKLNLVPFTQLKTDLANGQLPNFSFVIPNLLDDAHDGTLAAADQWLQANIAPVLADPSFQQDGLLIIVFDEAADTDTTNGGGQVAMVMVSSKNLAGFKSTAQYQHQNTLRTVLAALGISSFPGAAATAAPETDFFAP